MQRLSWTIAFALVACSQGEDPPSGPAQKQPQKDPAGAARLLAQAQQLRDGLRFNQALARVDGSLALDPRNADARRLKAEILLNLDRLDEASALLEPLREEQPMQPIILGLLGLVRREQGRTAEAVTLFDAMPEAYRPKREYVDVLKKLKRFEDAAIWSARILIADPWHDTAYYQLAMIDVGRDRDEQAKAWGDRHRSFEIIRARVNSLTNSEVRGPSPIARTKLAIALSERGLWIEAMGLLQQSVQVDGKQAGAFRLMGRLMRDLGQPVQAAQFFGRCAALLPKDADGVSEVAAEVAAQLAAAKAAGANRPIIDVAREHAAAGRADKARAAALFAAKQDPADPKLMAFVGELFDRDDEAFVRLWAWRHVRRLVKSDDKTASLITAECVRLGMPRAASVAGVK